MLGGGTFRSVFFRVSIMAMAAGLGRLIEHFRLFVALLFATGVNAKSDSEEKESGGLVHNTEGEVVWSLLSLPA